MTDLREMADSELFEELRRVLPRPSRANAVIDEIERRGTRYALAACVPLKNLEGDAAVYGGVANVHWVNPETNEAFDNEPVEITLPRRVHFAVGDTIDVFVKQPQEV